MRSLVSLLCFLCAPPLQCAFEGTCLRKAFLSDDGVTDSVCLSGRDDRSWLLEDSMGTQDVGCAKTGSSEGVEPSPGTLVLSPGSVLVLTCSGQVTVDGVKVRNGSNSGKRDSSRSTTQTTLKSISKTQVWTKSEKRSGAVSHGPSRDPDGETHMVHPTSADGLKADDTDAEEEEGGEESDGGSRVTRGLRRQWKWTRRTTNGKGDKDVTFTSEAELSLPSVKLADSGTYTCFYRGTEMHMFKVIVADPPETPSITCYKRSHSGKIRCESTPQERATSRPSCHLLSKRPTGPLHSSPCSYSSRTSRCWCTLEHKEEDRRASHYAFMCVTNIAGNVTSDVITFTPMGILKPDPPSNVTAWQMEGQETRMKVTWNLPTSWKHLSHFYKLSFELKYRPLMSSFHYEQLLRMKDQFSDTITDVLPGVDYLIQLRAQDEYDGVWSDWSAAICARSWTAPTATLAPEYLDTESSGTDDIMSDVAPTLTTVSSDAADVSTHILWISALLAYLSVILAVYIFSHRDRLLSKLQTVAFGGCTGDSPQPMASAPPAPEGQALVTLGPQSHQERPEEEEEKPLNENDKTMHFNNISYFFLQQ